MAFLNFLKPKRKNSDPAARETPIKNITDQETHIYTVKHDHRWWVRKEAASKITDQNILADVAKHDMEHSVREVAISKITDKNILAEVAKNDKNWQLRKAAIEKLTDQNILVDIAKNEDKGLVREVAISKITDQNILADVAKNDKDEIVRRRATRKLIDPKTLAEIAATNEFCKVRKAALEKLTDQEIIADVILERKKLRKKTLEEFGGNSLEWMRFEYDDMNLSDMELSALEEKLRVEVIWKSVNAVNFESMRTEFEIRDILIKKIGEELNERGGLKLMISVYDKIGGDRMLDMTWDQIGAWLG
jgi:hypothetical protein